MNYNKKSTSHRLKIIAGQINALAKMIDENKYCIDILTQSLAVQKAIQKVNQAVLENHLKTCVVNQIKNNKHKKAIEELIKIYSLSNNGKL